jgi:hypothetical protein
VPRSLRSLAHSRHFAFGWLKRLVVIFHHADARHRENHDS